MKISVEITTKLGAIKVSYEDSPLNHGLNETMTSSEFEAYYKEYVSRDPAGWAEIIDSLIEPAFESLEIKVTETSI